MSFFTDMFSTKAPAGPAGDPNQTVVQPQAGGISDTTTTTPTPEVTPPNALDEYKKMFDNSVKSSDIEAPTFKLDPEVLTRVTGNMDFIKGINPELMTKALAGDAQALMTVIQESNRNTYRASLEHTASLTDAHITNRAAFDQQRVDKGVKTQLTHDALSSAPNYSHPVVKAELNRVANTFAQANPDASPKQVAEAAQKYIQDLQVALTPKKGEDGTVAEGGPVDWSKFLS